MAAEGRITSPVDNAGIRGDVAVEVPLPDWQTSRDFELRVNFLSAVDLTRAAILHFRAHGRGRIASISSRAEQRGSSSSAMAYGATKAALINRTKSIAQSYGHDGIAAVAPAPG